MPTYVAFLRAINLGKTRKLPMADAREWLARAGLGEVETYIQTGNVRFSSRLRSRVQVEQVVERTLRNGAGFDVPTIVLTTSELRRVYDDALALPQPIQGETRRYVTFLKQAPTGGAAGPIDGWSQEGEAARVIGRAVHWWLVQSSRSSRLSNAHIEKHLGAGTTRDLKVVTTLAERWGSVS